MRNGAKLAENAASGRRQVPFLVLRAQVHRSYSIVEFAELENWIPARANRRFSMTEFTVNPNHREGSQPSTGRKRSEEHTSELQSRGHLVCRLLLEKKNRM